MNLDPIKPYARLLNVALLALMLSASFIGGCDHGQAKSAALIAKKDRALSDAALQLNAANNLLRQAADESQRRIAAEKQARQAAEQAGKIAAAQQAALLKRISTFDKTLARARRNPSCDALLNADIAKVCGL